MVVMRLTVKVGVEEEEKKGEEQGAKEKVRFGGRFDQSTRIYRVNPLRQSFGVNLSF